MDLLGYFLGEHNNGNQVAAVAYLTPYLGHNETLQIVLGITLLIAITCLNCLGVSTAGKAEFVLTILKIIPLLCEPLLGLYHFNVDHFVLDPAKALVTTKELLSPAILIAFYGFIGLESATTPAGSVEKTLLKTISRAVVSGTLCVAALYILN